MKKTSILAGLILIQFTAWSAETPIDGGSHITISSSSNYVGGVLVGVNDPGNSLTINSGAQFTNTYFKLGVNSGSDNNTVLITDNALLRTTPHETIVGNYGASNTLTISNGGDFHLGSLFMGEQVGADHNTINLTGSGSTLHATGWSALGNRASYNQINVSDNASFTSDHEFQIGKRSGANYNSLNLSSGAQATFNNKLSLGHDSSSASYNSISVDGTGTKINANNYMYVGNQGTHNELNISNAGAVNVTQQLFVGNVTDANSNVVNINSGGSLSVTNNTTYVGNQAGSNNNSLNITGSTSSAKLYTLIIGQQGANNKVTINNTGSLLTDQHMFVGNSGDNNLFEITSGGTAYVTSNLTVGAEVGSDTNVITIAGAGSSLTVGGSTIVGKNGKYSEMNILDGAKQYSKGNLYIGTVAGGNYNAITVSGAGSEITNNNFYVSDYGNYNTVTIENGASIKSVNTYVSYHTGSSNAVVITGADSTWNNTGSFVIGRGDIFGVPSPSSGNSVTIENGGTLNTDILEFRHTNSLHLKTGGRLSIAQDFDADYSSDPANFDWSGGTLAVGGELTGLSEVAAGRRLEATSITGDLNVLGTYAAGFTTGDSSTLDGNLAMGSGGVLEFTIQSLASYDTLDVSGNANLNGTLSIVLDGYTASYGDTFDFFDVAGSTSGNFATLPTLGGGLSWEIDETTGTGTVIPEPATATLIAGIAGLALLVRRIFTI